MENLKKDKDDLFRFYDYPAEHWIHIRTTNPIESTFATIRLRHKSTKGNGTAKATATADLGKLEKVVVMTALRSFTPLLYSSETLSGALQGLITHDMRDSGTLSLNQVVDVLEGKALSVLQKTISVIQIAVLVLFVLYLIVSIIIGRSYSISKKRTSKGISYGENIDG